MKIGAEQMAAMAEQAKLQFARKLAEMFRQDLPSRCAEMPRDELEELCLRGVRFCEQAGVETQREVARFLLYMLEIRVDFEASPPPEWAGSMLRDTSRPVQKRLDRIYAGVIRQGGGSA